MRQGKDGAVAPGVVYRYQAVDQRGKTVKGWIEAPEASSALKRLLSQGYCVLDLRERTWWEGFFVANKVRLSSRDRALFFRQMGLLLEAGVPLLKGLEALEVKARKKGLSLIVHDLHRYVLSGFSLWQAMEASRAFPEMHVYLVRCGETAGMLDKVLLDLAEYLDKEESRRKKVVKAAAYPLFVACVAFFVLGFLLFYALPPFLGLLDASDVPYPTLTEKLLTAIRVLPSSAPYLLFALVGMVVLGIFARKVDGVRRWKDYLLLRLPLGGEMLKIAELVRLARALSLLLRAGVPLLEALRFGRGVVANSLIGCSLEVALSRVEQGSEVAGSLTGGFLYDDVAGQLLATGEETGKLEAMLDKVGGYYEEEFDHRAEILLSLLQPLLILSLVFSVGILIWAVFLPIFEAITAIPW